MFFLLKTLTRKKSIEELQMKLAASEATTKKAQERWGHTEKLLQETILERNRLATWVDKFRASGNALKVCLYKFLAFYFKSKLTVNIQKTKDLIEKLKQTEKETRTNLEIFETEVKEYKLVDLVHRYRDYGWITCKDTLHQPPAWFNPEENFFTKETKAQFDERIQLHKSFLASKTDTFREEYTKSPITSLVRALKNAPEYRETWVANIAQAFICEMEKSKSVLLLDDGKKICTG